MVQNGLGDDCYVEMLDFTIDLFESRGLGADYYGYHNINHELEVTYISLLAASQKMVTLDNTDIKHLYIAALFHDFDPQKSVDKPHEESVIKFISNDAEICRMIDATGADIEVIKTLILRTTYPWSGSLRDDAERQIKMCLERAGADSAYWEHVMQIGEYLSVADRISGYSLGGFSKAMEMAKMNAHALAWKPSANSAQLSSIL